MKKLLFLFMLLLSLCACSSDDGDKEIRNVISVDGKEYPINRIDIRNYSITIYADGYELSVHNQKLIKGKINYLVDYEGTEARFMQTDDRGAYIDGGVFFVLTAKDMDKSSHVLFKDNEEDTRTYVEVYAKNNKHVFTVKYLGIPQYY